VNSKKFNVNHWPGAKATQLGQKTSALKVLKKCLADNRFSGLPSFSRIALASGAVFLTIVFLTACTGQRGQQIGDIPTQAAIDSLATAQFLTENAPPPGFRDAVSFPEVDANLDQLAGGRYVVQLEFDGVFAQTPRQTSAHASAEVSFNQVGSSRRVVVQITGEMLGREDKNFEAVRLGPDPFLVQDNQCLTKGDDAKTAANLDAGTLVGGVTRARPTGLHATINGLDSWQYAFATADLNLPSIHLADEGMVEMSGGELWVAPAQNAVARFYVNLDVSNAIIFDRQLPVTGQVIIRYDLYDAGKTANITVPFGC
jgi:hypothetical protein